MKDPFKIDSPTCISFSGGRTSAYMLWRVLESNGGKLPDDAKVLFANTGKECEETLDFVNDCANNWNVPITWLEYKYAEDTKHRFKVVNYESASRDGEPFAEMINKNGKPFLPNPVMRICTARLKIKPFLAYLRSIGWTEWDNMVGIRVDEQRRVAKIRANPGEDGGAVKSVERLMPLADANVTKEMVGDFWRNQSFDLRLPNHNGVTMHGNCDLCFLKSASQIGGPRWRPQLLLLRATGQILYSAKTVQATQQCFSFQKSREICLTPPRRLFPASAETDHNNQELLKNVTVTPVTLRARVFHERKFFTKTLDSYRLAVFIIAMLP